MCEGYCHKYSLLIKDVGLVITSTGTTPLMLGGLRVIRQSLLTWVSSPRKKVREALLHGR